MRLSTLLEVATSMHPDRAIVTGARGTLTLQELNLAARSLAAYLESEIRPGGALGFVGVNDTSVAIALFAADYARMPLAPVNYRADAPLLRHMLTTVDASVVIADERYNRLVADAVPSAQILSASACRGATTATEYTTDQDPDDPALYIFTSGTTALPKAVTLRHRHLVSYILGTVVAGQESDESVSLLATPPYHIATIMGVLSGVYSGRRCVLMEQFDPAAWLDAVDREGVTHAFVVPTMLFRILQHLKLEGRTAPKTLKYLSYGGAAASAALVREALIVFPDVEFTNAYGLSETSSTISVLDPGDHRISLEDVSHSRLGSVGKPLDGVEIRVSERGEILVRGPQVSGEYLGANSATTDGWFRTGDAGRLEKGYLYIEGRLDDMIIRGGENIAPLEVEDVVRRFPAVRDVAVIGIEDPEWGQRVEAVVEADQFLDIGALDAWTRSRLPSFKCPVEYSVVDELPRNDLGKVLRRNLRKSSRLTRQGPSRTSED